MDEVSRSNESEPRRSDESPSSSSSWSPSVAAGWCPRQLVFYPYSPPQETAIKLKPLRVVVKKPLVVRLTKDIVETYKLCNPEFKYAEDLNPKRFLTSPAIGVLNDGHDNSNSDLILSVNYVLVNPGTPRRYIVKEILGHGTFGQVAKCWDPDSNNFVAVKIIKNQPAYYQQALVEVSILTKLNTKFDPEDKHHIVRIYDCFVFQRHLCISFELLGTNLYELIKINNFRGLSLSIVQLFSKQILHGLSLMKDASIIHCDLKPENILLCASIKPAEVKIIDFGSACMEDRTVYSYIQSRYYRSPEVLLGYQYSTAIDMWSFGCIVAELFLGLPLFPGASEFDLLKRMIRMLGAQPPDYVLKEAKNTSKFFKYVGNVGHVDVRDVIIVDRSTFQALSEEEYEAREKKKAVIGKEYFNYMNLEEIVAAYPYRKNLTDEDIVKEKQIRLALIDFLKGLVEFDPIKRWSPHQALKHPFVTGEPFTCPYRPPPETLRVPVAQNFKVDHHPGGGHWFAAGLSPNVPGKNIAMHASPHFQMAPFAYSSSYGSLGSHGSYNYCSGLGSSYGSYGDNYNAFAYFSPVGPGMNIHAQAGMAMVGTSPDARRKMIQGSQGLGMSPTANLASLPLGTSPSQFTPPNSSQVSGSPGHYGSNSPARGTCKGSPLGKGAAFSQFHRRPWGHNGNIHVHEGPSSSHWQGHVTDGSNYNQPVGDTQIPSGFSLYMPSNIDVANWKQYEGGSGMATEYSSLPSTSTSLLHSSRRQYLQSKAAVNDAFESSESLPDPGDWDPNYSDEQLLQEGSGDACSIASEFNNGLHINQAPLPLDTAAGSGGSSQCLNMSNSLRRTNVPLHGFSQAEFRSTPLTNDLHDAFGRPKTKFSQFMPHYSQNSLSPLGQQQRFNLGRSANNASEGPHTRLESSVFSLNPRTQRSSGGVSHNNSTTWGRGATCPITDTPLSSRRRKDYTRIT